MYAFIQSPAHAKKEIKLNHHLERGLVIFVGLFPFPEIGIIISYCIALLLLSNYVTQWIVKKRFKKSIGLY